MVGELGESHVLQDCLLPIGSYLSVTLSVQAGTVRHRLPFGLSQLAMLAISEGRLNEHGQVLMKVWEGTLLKKIGGGERK